MDRKIIHVDMDAFFASVESRDHPELAGKPLIIGALPQERGVVSTCSYEARKYGVRSAMNIKEAYRRCPQGIYMHPDIRKYREVSAQLHEIWGTYTDVMEYISLDEGYLDVTGSIRLFGSARNIGQMIRERTRKEVGLTCSVGIGYSKATAKFASEEKKPDGFFEIPDQEFFRELIKKRKIEVLLGVGNRSSEKLHEMHIYTVQDLLENQKRVEEVFGKRGRQIVEIAQGIDEREVVPYYESEAKSISREHTFQQDSSDLEYLKSYLRIFAKELSLKLRSRGCYCQTVTLKITYASMKGITRSQTVEPTNSTETIYHTAAGLLEKIPFQPIRLIGIGTGNFTESKTEQISLWNLKDVEKENKKEELNQKLFGLQKKYGSGIIKTAAELEAETKIRMKAEKKTPHRF
ncbi:DNA polymerase IV [Blautia sp. HCP3S3_G3]|uniref:DNA polymerase IV n=1 Tax=Blautia sp. HCP3S3_G3 TaxID=3438913 RepID=UPI003F8A887C